MDDFKIRIYTQADKTGLIELLKLNIPQYFAESQIEEFKNFLDNQVEEYFIIEENHIRPKRFKK